jgi:hypothetical protein
MRKMLMALAGGALVVTLAAPAGASMASSPNGGPAPIQARHGGGEDRDGHFDDHRGSDRRDRNHGDWDHRDDHFRDGRHCHGYYEHDNRRAWNDCHGRR